MIFAFIDRWAALATQTVAGALSAYAGSIKVNPIISVTNERGTDLANTLQSPLSPDFVKTTSPVTLNDTINCTLTDPRGAVATTTGLLS